MLTNPGSKTVVIKPLTPINFPDSMNVSNLTIRGASDTENVLRLNDAGTNVPLTIGNSLTLGTNAALVSYDSAVVVRNLELDSKALFAESSQLEADNIQDYASLVLDNSFASARVAFVRQNSAIQQSGGTSQFDTLAMEANSQFSVVGGGLQVNYLLVQSAFFNAPTNGTATFVFDGGNMFVNSLILGEPSYGIQGDFLYKGGNLVCSNYSIWNGTFEQSSGTNAIATLALPPGLYFGTSFYAEGTYTLSAGTLLTSNLSLGQYVEPGSHSFNVFPGKLVQSGGVHTNTILGLQGFLFGPPPGYDQWPISAGSGRSNRRSAF